MAFISLSHDTAENTSPSNSDVMKQHVEIQGDTRSAVIVLSFGIILTAILVVFAACLCRGRRSWKGKRLNVDGDADYLIDGMYL